MGNHSDEELSSSSFHDEDEVRAYALERTNQFIAREYPGVNAMDPHLRAPIVAECAEHVVEIILKKMDRAEDFDRLILSAGLIRQFLAGRNFKADSGQQQRKREPLKARPERPLGSPTPFVWQKPRRREWLHANHYIRKYVTATVAPGGVGKSSNAIVEVLAMVTGLPLPFCGIRLGRGAAPLRVWYVNGEDPLDEVNLRFAAAMQHFVIKPEDVEGRLFVDTGREKDFVFARDEGKSVALAVPLVDSVVAGIEEMKIDVLILDPFVAFHLLPESDNTKINQVVRLFAEIADETNASVELVSHTRKTNGAEVGVEDARGAKALIDGARSVRTANPMTEVEGEKAGLNPGEFMSFFRLDNGKPNMVKRGSGSTWRRMASVKVECEDGHEDVGVCEAWRWPKNAADESIVAQAAAPLAPLTDDDEAVLKLIEDRIMKRKFVVYGEISPNSAPKLFSKGVQGGRQKKARATKVYESVERLIGHGRLHINDGYYVSGNVQLRLELGPRRPEFVPVLDPNAPREPRPWDGSKAAKAADDKEAVV